jgi:hypothetical protein
VQSRNTSPAAQMVIVTKIKLTSMVYATIHDAVKVRFCLIDGCFECDKRICYQIT